METLIEERVELMVCDEKGHSFLRNNHFLKPFVTSSIDGSVSKLPYRKQSHSVSSSSKLEHLFSRNTFSGFWKADSCFVSWLGKMEALYEPIWRKSGIFEAIKASTYNIVRNHSLILSVAENWCSETKSFIFPWGEATITLEDVMVLLGFSVLGSPVFAPLESSEMRDSAEKLCKVRTELNRRDHGVRPNVWILSFLGRDDEMEHEAFLVLWLSLFVFPVLSGRRISSHVIPIAVRLARGEMIALAPVVLASIYRDLGQISDLARGVYEGDKIHFKSLLKLVQVWTWERFKNIRPKAREIPKGEPRIAQWGFQQQRPKNVRLSFDDFEWRPYIKPLKNWNPLRLYVEEAMWVTIDDGLDDEFVSFARCVRVSQLVGDGFVEDYYPNRVAMQFGLAQDLPGLITHNRNFIEKEAWDDYSRSLVGLKLYMPARLARGSVTVRYQDWWLKSVSEFLSSEKMRKESTEAFNARNTVDRYDGNDLDVSPIVFLLRKVVQKIGEGDPTNVRRSRTCRLAKKHNKQARVDDDDECLMDKEDDSLTIAQTMSRSTKKYNDSEESEGGAFEQHGRRTRKFQVEDSDDDSEPCQKLASIKIEQRNKEEGESASKPQKKRQVCDDEVDVYGSDAEKKTMTDDGTNDSECWLHEDGEKQVSNDDEERWKRRKLVREELALDLEHRMMKVQKSLAVIRKWKIRVKQDQN